MYRIGRGEVTWLTKRSPDLSCVLSIINDYANLRSQLEQQIIFMPFDLNYSLRYEILHVFLPVRSRSVCININVFVYCKCYLMGVMGSRHVIQ